MDHVWRCIPSCKRERNTCYPLDRNEERKSADFFAFLSNVMFEREVRREISGLRYIQLFKFKVFLTDFVDLIEFSVCTINYSITYGICL